MVKEPKAKARRGGQRRLARLKAEKQQLRKRKKGSGLEGKEQMTETMKIVLVRNVELGNTPKRSGDGKQDTDPGKMAEQKGNSAW